MAGQMARACVFCGDDSKPLHKEHIFADWIAKIYGSMPTGISQAVDQHGITKTWGKNAFQDKVRIVCQDRCNGGWMSDLEDQIKPILGPMITKGWSTSLSPVSQREIAFWAVKTALVLDQFQPSTRVIPDSEYPALYSAQRPLPSHLVWLSRRNSPGDNLASSFKESIGTIRVPNGGEGAKLTDKIRESMSEGKGLYRVTFSVGFVVFQVFGHTLPTTLDIEEGADNAEYTQRIWPPNDQIIWPPPKGIEEVGGLSGLHRMWGGNAQAAPRPDMSAHLPNRQERRAAPRQQRRNPLPTRVRPPEAQNSPQSGSARVS